MLAGEEAVVKVLIAHGADPNIATQEGWLPLVVAASECFELIMERKACSWV